MLRGTGGAGGPQGRGQGCPQGSLFPWTCVILGLAWPCSHRAWLSALTLIMVYLSDWPSHNSPGPLITEGEERLQIEVLPGYNPAHNTIMYLSTNHKEDLLCVLRLDHDLGPLPFYPVGSQDFTSQASCSILSTN